MKILVIEDDLNIQSNLAEWLEFEGFSVATASDGRQGIQKALEFLPNLIISDISMPEMNGYDVIETLHTYPQLAGIPFIFLTALTDKSFVRVGMELGADDYLTKPFTRPELLSAINARLERHKAIATTVRQEVEEVKLKLIRLVSHELRTPLTSLIFVQQVLERQLEMLSREEIADMLSTIRVGTDRLQHLIQQTVLLAKIETGLLTQASIEEMGTTVYLWQLIPDAVEHARRYAFRNRDGHIVVDQRDIKNAIFGDALLLKQALSELLTNALNFSDESNAIYVTRQYADNFIWIRVVDQGFGMTQADTVKAQKPFEQVGRDRREQQGLGLGLTVARQIVELHKGFFHIESQVSKGTEVTLGFPAVSPTT